MNAAHPSGSDREEAQEVSRLLPEAPEWDLPRGRHRHHKDILMQQIDLHHESVAAATPPHGRASAAPTPLRRRLLRPAVAVPVAALALTGALAATLTFTGDDHGATPVAQAPASDGGATVLLNQIADASLRTDTAPVKDGQYVYVRSTVRSNEGTFAGPVELGAPHRREVWMAQTSKPVKTLGTMKETGRGVPMSGQLLPYKSTDALAPGLESPTYAWLASLPTDPDQLLDELYAGTRTGGRESEDQAVFEKIGSLLDETVMPPKNAAALYKAVARIPGIKRIPDAVDAAGRHGVGVARQDDRSASRSEWIFDSESLTYLGSRSYLDKDGKGMKLAGTNAILRRTVVDKSGTMPADTTADS
ncbi:CU044_5270 family protein [Streptomyces sp. NBC_01446]|uniref:CU044_5270 family protein n=1 Tax=Streptomyces sp. NBC_00119 TaxID=2975659 RepID=A0AAU1UJC6_9ACTN|nr:CU044_5270 family protein [Streptomyces sp. NBC_01446]MCX4647790.1 CU044_5270 family protein [Streptomyces sp. NBC_01446]